MARKAVQGYPEKSYYDNTRYLGMVATTDPLQEGFFKHIVNFDISDTGQSVQPRDGFVTTTLNGDDIISLSNKTIVFKSPDDSAFVFYDFSSKTGYLADVSSYNLQNNYINIETEIGSYDWSSFINYLDLVVPAVHTYYVGSSYNATLTYVQSYLTIIPETKVEFIYNEDGIRKTLVKAYLAIPNNPTVTLTIQMYYRSDAVTINGVEYASGNVLIFECVDNFLHPTLVTSERNLSVSKSIIPEVMQTLYTSSNRPSGHISNLGNFIYFYDNDDNYLNNFMYRNVNYNIKPYFALNPAYYDLNNNVNTDDKWAYRLELFNTSVELGDNTTDTVFTTPWFTYNQDGQGTELFSINTNTISLGNADKSLNQYKTGRYLIYVVSKVLNTTSSSYGLRDDGTVTEELFAKDSNGNYQVSSGNESFSTITSRNSSWVSTINNITDYKSLLSAIENLSGTAYFYLYDLHTDPTTGSFKSFEELMNSVDTSDIIDIDNMYHTVSKNTADDEYDILMTGTELIDEIKARGIFKNRYGVIFHLLPFATNDTFIETTEFNSFESNEDFGTQAPYYSTQDGSGNPTIDPEALDLPKGTIVQALPGGKMFKVDISGAGATKTFLPISGANISVRPFVSLTYGPEDSDGTFIPFSTGFLKDALYKDTRTNTYYRWTEDDVITGKFEKATYIAPTNEVLRFGFASLNYWSTPQDYIVKRNKYSFNKFDMTRFNWDTLTWDISTDLTTLKTATSETPITFSSGSYFDNYAKQPPWYVVSVPSFNAPYNTVVQASNGVYYRQTANPSGSSWGIGIGGGVYPSAFTNGQIYKDTRTGFTYRWDNPTGTEGRFTSVSLSVPNLEAAGFFDKGISGIFYMRPYEEDEYIGNTYAENETLKITWNATALTQSFNLQYGFDDLTVTYIEKTITKDPNLILNSMNQVVFENSRLLVWNKNVLYISEQGRYYWFKAVNKIEFGEDIVKVLEYKALILVFTTQNLYAVYRVETIQTTVNPATNQLEQNVTGVAWLKQAVLYNLLVDKRYADVIQVFNQMILFYSADGQLYMIRPNTTIDDQTRFSMQYFNKAVNDVLENYHDYMNERLAMYGSNTRVTKDQVKIKALVSVGFIKMFYYVPGVMTYILVYDVVNNRYTVYDTLTFTNIYDKVFVESGDLYITEHNNKLFLSMHYVEPNVRDNHVDITFTNNFKKEGINALIDTGNLNLNNHLHKRFRDLHVVFKNLNSSNLLFNLETNIDDIIAKPFYNTQLEVRDLNGASYFIPVPKLNDNDLIELVDINQISETATDALKYSLTNNLFENNNVLMDFSEFTSSKLLTHRTSILGLGKVFRLKLQFVSKGLYKLQHFGIIYKERRI